MYRSADSQWADRHPRIDHRRREVLHAARLGNIPLAHDHYRIDILSSLI